MRVGVYIDGYNLYYGGRHQLGKTPGSRWLDLRALVTTLVAEQQSWPGAVVDRIVYCTARIDQSFNPAGFAEQDVYLTALVGAGSVDYIEVDAVIVVSNDSDLQLPIHTARDHVPVGHVNPRGGLFAGT